MEISFNYKDIDYVAYQTHSYMGYYEVDVFIVLDESLILDKEIQKYAEDLFLKKLGV